MNFATLKGLTIPEGNVTKITDASGRVLWSSTIKFTINGDTYIADRGMTWAEWFASDYNTTGETEGTITDASGNEVSMDAVIVGDAVYEVEFAPPFVSIVDFGTVTISNKSAPITLAELPAGYDACTHVIINDVVYEATGTVGNDACSYSIQGSDSVYQISIGIKNKVALVISKENGTYNIQLGIQQ